MQNADSQDRPNSVFSQLEGRRGAPAVAGAPTSRSAGGGRALLQKPPQGLKAFAPPKRRFGCHCLYHFTVSTLAVSVPPSCYVTLAPRRKLGSTYGEVRRLFSPGEARPPECGLSRQCPEQSEYRKASKLQVPQIAAESARQNEQVQQSKHHPSRSQLEREVGKVQPDGEADSKSQGGEH